MKKLMIDKPYFAVIKHEFDRQDGEDDNGYYVHCKKEVLLIQCDTQEELDKAYDGMAEASSEDESFTTLYNWKQQYTR